MIKFIIFDLSEVLLKGVFETGLKLREKHNVGGNGDPRAGFMLKSFQGIHHPLIVPAMQEFFNGNISEEEYLNEVLTIYPELGTKEYLKETIRKNFMEIEGTRKLILELRRIGYKTALLSAHGKEWVEYCEKKFDYHKLFDVVTYSFEDKATKPDHNAFRLMLKKLEAKPEECLFIDDSETNVKAAEEIGIKGIIFTSPKELDEKLSLIIGLKKEYIT